MSSPLARSRRLARELQAFREWPAPLVRALYSERDDAVFALVDGPPERYVAAPLLRPGRKFPRILKKAIIIE